MTRNTKDQTLRGRLRQIFLFSWRDCVVCVGILAAAALLCALLRMIDSSDVYVALIFECAVVLVSRFTDGYLFGLLASVIGVVGVNWIFTYPYMQLNFTISGYPLTFLVMLAVSVVVGTLTTQIKQQEKLRAEAEREKMRGNLLRAVSHDIRTPLTAIVGGIDAILENGSQISPETSRDLLENMRDESNWLIGVVENLLSVTRMSGASNIKKELEAGEEVLGAASMKFKRHYPAVEVSIAAPDTLLRIPMDIILIEQVLINLMENAVHIRQAEVENDDIRTVRCDHGIRHRTRAGHKHVVAVCRQDRLHKAADGPLVLDQKNLISDVHGCFPPMAMKIAAERRLFSGFPHASYRRAPARWTYIQTGRCPYCAAGRRSPPDRG